MDLLPACGGLGAATGVRVKYPFHGQAEVMKRFFRDLARHFPRDPGGTYARRMNWDEYVHFTTSAAAADVSGQAARAFAGPASGRPTGARP